MDIRGNKKGRKMQEMGEGIPRIKTRDRAKWKIIE
jgi:hypothetical protein